MQLVAIMEYLRLFQDYAPTQQYTAEGRLLFKLLRDVELGDGRVASSGFLTDWGSVPKKIDDWFGIDNRRGSVAYLRHDFNYQTGFKSRIMSDLELRIDQKSEGVPYIERQLVFWGLRIGGKKAYQKYRSQD